MLYQGCIFFLNMKIHTKVTQELVRSSFKIIKLFHTTFTNIMEHGSVVHTLYLCKTTLILIRWAYKTVMSMQ
jgi:hypothetical protein